MQPEVQNQFVKPKAEESAVQVPPVQEPAVQEAPHEGPIQQPAADGPEPQAPRRGRRAKTSTHYQRRKARLLPEITQLALDGHSGESIARRFDLPARTVNHWLQEARRQWMAGARQGAEELVAVEWARLNGLYREALEAWRKAQADADAWVDQQRKAGENGKGGRKMLRLRPPRRNDALLGRALATLRDLRKFHGPAAPMAVPVAPAVALPLLPVPRRMSAEELDRLSDEDLVALEAALKARCDMVSAESLAAASRAASATPAPQPSEPCAGTCP